MSQYPPPMGTPQYAPVKPKKGWFGRNWFWFIPLVILLPILCCCGGGIFMVNYGIGQIMQSTAYTDTLTTMQQNSDVQRAIGTPIDTPEGFMDLVALEDQGGTINLQAVGSQQFFDARIPISGPKGSGVLIIEAESPDAGSTWTYKQRRIEVTGTGEVIELMPGGSTGNTPATIFEGL